MNHGREHPGYYFADEVQDLHGPFGTLDEVKGAKLHVVEEHEGPAALAEVIAAYLAKAAPPR